MIAGIGCWMMSAMAAPVFAQAPLFPQAFLVEHQIVQTDVQGSKTLIGPVTDHYGGSGVVSVQPAGKRTIVDFSQERLTVIDDRRGRYATIGFDRIAELNRRHRLAEFGSETPLDEPHDREAPTITVSEPLPMAPKSSRASDQGLMVQRPGMQRFRVEATSEDNELGALELWVDAEIRLSPQALGAVERFERSMLGRPATQSKPGFQDLLAEGRRHSGGGLVLGSSHSLVFGQTPEKAGVMNDVALRVEVLPQFPTELLEIPEHFVRVPHPLETIVAHAEREADLRRRMSEGQ